jgi:glycosyltransferase involved in cell wall biosynthesis
MLILPTYTDTWGLVVNEAMACGTPVVLSHAAGCAVDLLKEDWNGLLISPQDIDSLAAAMLRLAGDPVLTAQMGRNSAQLISRFSPREWCAGVAQAVAGSGRAND